MKKTIIPFVLVAYEIVIANSALRASLFIYYLISNTGSRNNIVKYLFQIILNEKRGGKCLNGHSPHPSQVPDKVRSEHRNDKLPTFVQVLAQ